MCKNRKYNIQIRMNKEQVLKRDLDKSPGSDDLVIELYLFSG